MFKDLLPIPEWTVVLLMLVIRRIENVVVVQLLLLLLNISKFGQTAHMNRVIS